jgi:hypothetical protein
MSLRNIGTDLADYTALERNAPIRASIKFRPSFARNIQRRRL